MERTENEKDDNKYIPNEFFLESKFIFLSSREHLPEELTDEILAFEVDPLKDEAISNIITALSDLLPDYSELDIEDKKAVITFLKKHTKSGEKITFKMFLHVALIFKSNNPNKEDWALLQLKE